MSAHTPGPWGASDNTGKVMQSYSQPSVVHGTGEHRLKLICGCFGDIGGPDVAAANARLIAAAPDLLAALDKAIHMVHAKGGMDQAVIGEMYAAWRKAKGLA